MTTKAQMTTAIEEFVLKYANERLDFVIDDEIENHLMTFITVPKEVKDSDVWTESPIDAYRLYRQGFLPVTAMQVEAGQEVIYRPTWFGFRSGDTAVARATDVHYDDERGEVVIYMVTLDGHDLAPGEADELEEVWVRADQLHSGR
jgi:hypothetical protein